MTRRKHHFDLEKAVATWRRAFEYRRSITRKDADELERHLRDHVAFLVDAGTPEQDAFRVATNELGHASEAESEYGKVYWDKVRRRGGMGAELSARGAMMTNYLKVTLRSLAKQRAYTAVNLLGLTVGIVACIVIYLFVRHERSFDRFHPDAERVYRVNVIWNGEFNNALSSAPVGPVLEESSPDVEEMVRIVPSLQKVLASVDDRHLYVEASRFMYADTSVFEMFDFGLAPGDPASALVEPRSVVLTRSTAQALFGDEDPVGRVVRMDNARDYRVTGLVIDVPENAHFDFDLLASWDYIEESQAGQLTDWTWNPFFTYVRLTSQEAAGRLSSLFPDIVESNATDNFQRCCTLALQPLTEIHLDPKGNEIGPPSSRTYVQVLSIIAVLILLIAGFNFVNLATARAVTRMKEISMRKVVGAGRPQLILQFLGESTLLAVIASIIAMGALLFLLPTIGNVIGKDLDLALDGRMAMVLVAVVLAIGGLAGIYPALVLSRFNPVDLFRGRKGGARKQRIRGSLVVFQFAVSVALIVATLVVVKQLHFMRTAALGLEAEQVVAIPMPTDDSVYDATVLRQRLVAVPGVVQAGFSSRKPGMGAAGTGIRRAHWSADERIGSKYSFISHDYLEALGIEILVGRGFSRDFPTDEDAAVVINQEALDTYDWNSPGEAVGDYLVVGRDTQVEVIGVVRNFHFQTFRTEMQPMAMFLTTDGSNHLFLRVDTQDVARTIAGVTAAWEEVLPEWPIQYSFLDEDYDKLYAAEARFSRVFGLFTGVAIFIACLGLFGLAAYAVERRTKEMGVRKALGATGQQIMMLISRDIGRLVVIANLIAWPVAWYGAARWLETYPFRTSLGVGVFLAGALAALIIAWFSISVQVVRASRANPVEVLRYE